MSPTPGIQNDFLNALRKERKRVAIYLVNGIKLTGHIQSFDTYMVYVASSTGAQTVFKHAIATVGEDQGPTGGSFKRTAPSRSPR